MPYIQRDKDNKVQGIFARIQPGLAEELVDDSDPDVLEYLNRKVWSSVDNLLILAHKDSTTQEKLDAQARIDGKTKPTEVSINAN